MRAAKHLDTSEVPYRCSVWRVSLFGVCILNTTCISLIAIKKKKEKKTERHLLAKP